MMFIIVLYKKDEKMTFQTEPEFFVILKLQLMIWHQHIAARFR